MALFIGDTTTGERHFMSGALERAIRDAAGYVGMRPEVFAAGPLTKWKDDREAALGTGALRRRHEDVQAMLDEEVQP